MIVAMKHEDTSGAAATDDRLPHILLVVDQLPKTLGGGERIALKLAALLPSYGYRTSILTFFIHPECSVRDSPPCPIYELPLQRTYDFTAVRAALEFRRFLRSQRIQIVQTFFESSDLWAGIVTKTVPPVRLIWSRRDMGILRSRKHHISYRLFAGAPDAVFAVSEQVRWHCIDVDRIDPCRVLTIHNGLDLSDWKPLSKAEISDGKVVIATVGNIRAVKGHDVLIRAAALTVPHFPDISFHIAGEILENAYFAELQALVRDLNLEDHVTFDGGVSDLRSYLAETDIFVLPSRSEGFSNAIVEAMAAGLPVVATDVGGNREAVQDGVNGFLVPSEDPAALSWAMRKLLSDRGRARSMGAAGRDIVEGRFTTAAMMSRIVGVYEALLGGQ
jgi:glycosyltransferase involved in cell wall biosynthesis